MRKLKSVLAIVLAVILVCSCFMITSSAENESISVKILNFNVAGLPKLDGTDIPGNQKVIANYVNENDFDIFATQENFGYHRNLANNLDGYNYQTNHTGSIPGGDGLNIFTKSMPIYNEERYQWNDSFGDIAEGDTLTPKGILYSVIEIGDGIYVDFYDIHADAFDGDGSRVARESNFRQVSELINENYEKNNRPVILTGDFNIFFHTTPEINSNMYSYFIEQCGLTDAWIELHNNGDFNDFSSWYATGLDYWGGWDSVERVMYKNGGGVELSATDFKYTWVTDENGARVSDHAAAECTIDFTKTDEFVENTQELEVVKVSIFRNFFNTIKWIFKDLVYILSNIDELIELIS